MQLYMTASAAQEPAARRCGTALAHLCYRIGDDGHLLRAASPKGGVLVLTDAAAGVPAAYAPLLEELAGECRQGGFSGVLADFERPLSEAAAGFLAALEERLRAGGKTLFVPERCAVCAPRATVLISTALSGGSLELRLRQAVQRHGARRTALDVQWLRMDFPLPCRSGEGRLLSAEELARLEQKYAPLTFFSRGLCARYFTCRQGQEHRFILFDTAETVTQKLRIGKNLGCAAAFFLFGEAPEEWRTLLSALAKEKVL